MSTFMDDLILSGEEILTNTIIWMEVGHYLYKVSRLPRATLFDVLKKLMDLPTLIIVDVDVQLLYDSLSLLADLFMYPIGGRDATILAAMNRFNVRKLVSHDEGFKRLARDGLIEVIDPVVQDQLEEDGLELFLGHHLRPSPTRSSHGRF